MCTGFSVRPPNVPSNVQGMDLMVLQQRAEPLDDGGRLVLVHLDHSTAAAQPTVPLVSKVR